MKNFTCPNCKVTASLRDIVPNKRMRENIGWFKNLIIDINSADQPTLKINNIINNIPSSNTIQAEKENTIIKKLDMDKIISDNNTEMTPEEKMEMYNNKIEAKLEEKAEEDKDGDKIPSIMPVMKPEHMMYMQGNFL